MSTTQKLSVTLPNHLADAIKAKVEAGIYATESDVIRDGLRALIARDHAMENWLRNQVGPAFDALKSNPSSALSISEIRARLAAEHEIATTKL